MKSHTYDLTEIKLLISQGNYRIRQTALDNAAYEFGFSSKDIIDTVLSLNESDFYKTMKSKDYPSLWQDVYHKEIDDTDTAYIKLQINQRSKAVIIQFKQK